MISSACQNSAKQRIRRWMSARKPLATTCAIMVSSHRMPAETCPPSYQREEGRQECAARRTGAARDEVGEFMEFDPKERQAQNAGHGHRDLEPEIVALLGGDTRHAAGETRQEQTAGLDRDAPEVE